MELTAFFDMPVKVIFGADSAACPGPELAALGARNVGVVTGARTRNLVDKLLEGLAVAGRKVVGVFECDRLEPSELDDAVATLRECDAVVSLGGWLQTSLSMYLCGELQAIHVAIAVPPGLSTSLACAPIPLKGCLPPRERYKRPSLAIFDPVLIMTADRGEVEAEAIALCAKAIGLRMTNHLAGVIGRCALEELKGAIARGDLKRLCFAATVACLANGLLRASATSALARALHALYGIDPFLAELSILPTWLTRILEGSCLFKWDDELSRLKEIRAFLENLGTPSLKQLGLKMKALDLVVEFVLTYELYCVEPDPIASDKYSLRELLSESMRR